MNHHLLILSWSSRGLYKQRKFITGHCWPSPNDASLGKVAAWRPVVEMAWNWSGDGCGVVSGYLELELFWLRWGQHRKGRCCLEHRGRRRNPVASLFFSHVLWLLLYFLFPEHLGRGTVLGAGKDREERGMKQRVISSSGSVMPEFCVWCFQKGWLRCSFSVNLM